MTPPVPPYCDDRVHFLDQVLESILDGLLLFEVELALVHQLVQVEESGQTVPYDPLQALANDDEQRDVPVRFGVHDFVGLRDHADHADLPFLRKITDRQHVVEQILEASRGTLSHS